MHGENIILWFQLVSEGGTSPRARGKPAVQRLKNGEIRNIPACAGKTSIVACRMSISQEHPRVRGENCNIEALTPLP